MKPFRLGTQLLCNASIYISILILLRSLIYLRRSFRLVWTMERTKEADTGVHTMVRHAKVEVVLVPRPTDDPADPLN